MQFRSLCFGLICTLLFTANAPAAERPNILFCIADDASYPYMSAYGSPWVKTPGFDRVAREGLLFTRAYTPNAKCAPSRACLLTGRNSWQLEEAANHVCFFPEKFKTYCEALGDHGYFVGFTGKGWGPGVAGTIAGKPRQLTGTPFSKRRAKPPAQAMSNVDYAANFEEFLSECPTEKPFCFWYGGFEPHRPYEAGIGKRLGGKQISEIDRVPGFWPDNETIRNDMLDYAFEVEYFDSHLQRMLQALEEADQLENTLVVVTSDNGMPFPRCKGQSYEFSNHMPLAIMWKRGIHHPGRKIDDFVSFIDLAPTFLEVAGVTPSESGSKGPGGMQPIQGRSLLNLFTSDRSGQIDPERDHVLIGKERHDLGRPHDQGYPIRGIIQGNFLYLRNFEPTRWPVGNPETGYMNTDGSPTKTECLQARTRPGFEHFWQESFGRKPAEELYDLSNDVDCLKNLAEQPEFARQKASLEQRMIVELTDQADPRMFGRGKIFDEYPYAEDRLRGFYERFRRGEKLKAGWITPSDIEPEPLD